MTPRFDSPEWSVLVRVKIDDGCWLWSGATSPKGYGQCRYRGTTRFAHRVVYEMLVGPIPEGLELDHLCRVHNCVRPDHLEPVTHAENMRRSHRGNRGRINAAKTHCPYGHPYDEANTRRRPGRNTRECRECDRRRHRKTATRRNT